MIGVAAMSFRTRGTRDPESRGKCTRLESRVRGNDNPRCCVILIRPCRGIASQPSRRERVRHQLADSVPVERNDEKKIEFAGEVVNAADGGDDDARSVAVRHFQDR